MTEARDWLMEDMPAFRKVARVILAAARIPARPVSLPCIDPNHGNFKSAINPAMTGWRASFRPSLIQANPVAIFNNASFRSGDAITHPAHFPASRTAVRHCGQLQATCLVNPCRTIAWHVSAAPGASPRTDVMP